jgi:Resolvase, N terminal domain
MPPCRRTFTVLPDWSPPYGHYSLYCRQQAWESLHEASNWEESIPHTKEPDRLPDPSTVRRWAGQLFCRSLTETIETETPTGRVMSQMIGMVAEYGHSLIAERTRAGVKDAKKRGVKFGRKKKLGPAQITKARRLIEAGERRFTVYVRLKETALSSDPRRGLIFGRDSVRVVHDQHGKRHFGCHQFQSQLALNRGENVHAPIVLIFPSLVTGG